MSDETVAHLLTGICEPCASDNHDGCVAEYLGVGCICQCCGTVECPTCGSTVVMWADPNEEGLSNGECCHWMWADWWEGTFRYDLSQSAQVSNGQRSSPSDGPGTGV